MVSPSPPSVDTPPIDTPSIDTGRPFTRAAAVGSGVAPAALRSASYRRVLPGVYLSAAQRVDPVVRVLAALALFDESAHASHASAARVYGAPIPTLPDEHVTVPEARLRRRRRGVVCHTRAAGRVREVRGVRVSAPEQLFVELARELHLVDLVVVGDWLVRQRLVSLGALVHHCGVTDDPGAVAARRAARFVREGVDSPMETRLRMLLVLAGLPEPQINLLLRDHDGEPLRRFDLSWPAVRAAAEYDGRHHIDRQEQWEADLDRREAIDDDGWRLLVVTSAGIHTHPERTVLRVWRLLRARRLPGVPTRPGDAWRPYFPGRD